jgi:hypothetical protein
MAKTMIDAGRMKHAPVADVDRQLGRVRAGNEVGRAEKIEKLLARHPGPPAHDLLFHERDVRGRAAERGCAEPEEEQRQLAQATVARSPSPSAWPEYRSRENLFSFLDVC